MSFVNNLLKIFVGDKSKKDLKTILPLVEKIKSFQDDFIVLSNDELRGKTIEFKEQIKSTRQAIDQEIDALKTKIDQETDIDVRESHYNTIDRLEKEALEKVESTLNDILPAAFAVVKETARRFANNETLAVTANAFDRELAQNHAYVVLNNDEAVWHNSWDAAGKSITWDMIHYDVQLIGGIAMHQGKIAEMQTGEGKTLVATLPVYLNALTGKGVHLVTVNDYLAKRDSAWMAPFSNFMGYGSIVLICINPTLQPEETPISLTSPMEQTMNLVSTICGTTCRIPQRIWCNANITTPLLTKLTLF